MKILIAGDFMPLAIQGDNTAESMLGETKPIIDSADYSLVNFECPVVESVSAKPINKCGPNMKCGRVGAEIIRWAGFKGVTLANNHFLDYGETGVQDTLTAMKDYGIDCVGGGLSLAMAAEPLYKEMNGQRIAVINCCEHEFSIATSQSAGSNPLNAIQQYYAIQEAKKHAQYVMVIAHGGHEMCQLPSPRMQETYRFFIDSGADAVVNHHQHCFSGFEYYKGKPIFYGLGNYFLCNSAEVNTIWNQGYLLQLDFRAGEAVHEIFPYHQCNGNKTITMMDSGQRAVFAESLRRINSIISDESRLLAEHQQWMKNNSRHFRALFSPYSNRFLQTLCGKGLLPNFLTKSKILQLINYVECEAHRDRTVFFLNERGRNQ